ncbi:hypothetical protein AJ79_07855 [Helicocarpus griseus UAMH5409]|uniref:Glucanase n=1 Tax=Helicocarpus griseus UAMH5409 TaxID=1447875 RepID=A0A2B7WYU3_9EURO|nr:hypothetical protein AJ79_07855 [Helicocarpus griseus UAMH5409]
MLPLLAATSVLVGLARGQAAGSEEPEQHPALSWQTCTGTGGASCTDQAGEVVLDANWRWLHVKGGYTNCYTGNAWNETACPDNAACAENCEIEGADYEGTYGITTSGSELSLRYTTTDDYGTSIGSRVYLMDSPTTYAQFNLLDNEFTFDVDVSQIGCGLNGALYFVNMPVEGQGEAGAEYGLGYCDSQCPRDLKFIDGLANAEGWVPNETDENVGVGNRGACCAEMDIWEANSISTALTPHSCDTVTFTECEGESCGGTYSEDRYGGTCDPNGCDFNAYRLGVRDFYGDGKTVDTTQPMTVVTQFLTEGGTLSEIKRYYVQNGAVIELPEPAVEGITGNSITQPWCDNVNQVFAEEVYPFNDHGGMQSMSDAMAAGMTLVMSLWSDNYANMLWLDSTYPVDADPEAPGVARGECPTDSGVPADLVEQFPDATVKFSNIKFGPIGSTFDLPAAQKKARELKEQKAKAKA